MTKRRRALQRFLQGDDQFDGADDGFEEARAEENVFDAERAE